MDETLNVVAVLGVNIAFLIVFAFHPSARKNNRHLRIGHSPLFSSLRSYFALVADEKCVFVGEDILENCLNGKRGRKEELPRETGH